MSLYLHLASERFGSDGRFVDKTLEAGTHLGLILALFPSAPIIWCRREPLDCGWSAFRTYFARGVDWSWDLADIGRRLAEEDAIFRHWQALAPERVAVIQYERLVTDPAAHIEQIARAAGVPFESAMQEPHRNARSVTTASVSQVRRPISSGSVGAAQPYRGWLQPMAVSTLPAWSATDLVAHLLADLVGALIAGAVLAAVRRPDDTTDVAGHSPRVPADSHPGSIL